MQELPSKNDLVERNLFSGLLINFHVFNLEVAIENIADQAERNSDGEKGILNLGVIGAVDQHMEQADLDEHRVDHVHYLYCVLYHHWVVKVWE